MHWRSASPSTISNEYIAMTYLSMVPYTLQYHRALGTAIGLYFGTTYTDRSGRASCMVV